MKALLGRALIAVLVVLAVACVACGSPPAQTANTTPPAVGPLRPSEPFGLTSVTLRDPNGTTALALPVYDAFTPAARQRGLMHRKRLPRQAGMVFRFPEDHRGGFWMKNTLIPLSIAFFDAGGKVVAVLDMPPCKADPCPSYDPKVTYRGAVEVNRGFFDDVGLRRGWRIELPFGLPPPG